MPKGRSVLGFGVERSAAAAASRRAAILALPLRSEAETDEERAIFEAAQAALREGRRGYTTDEMLGEIDR